MARMGVAAVVVAALLAVGGSPAFAQGGGQGEKPKEAAQAAQDPITGDWEGSVALPNGNVAFYMKLKVEKDKVSGDIGSDQGATQCTGTWADGKLTLSFTYVNGEAISMTGAMNEDQLGGDIVLGGGQVTTVWVAKKKA